MKLEELIKEYLLQARCEGYSARAIGFDKTNNQYDPIEEKELYDAWLEGWEECFIPE